MSSGATMSDSPQSRSRDATKLLTVEGFIIVFRYCPFALPYGLKAGNHDVRDCLHCGIHFLRRPRLHAELGRVSSRYFEQFYGLLCLKVSNVKVKNKLHPLSLPKLSTACLSCQAALRPAPCASLRCSIVCRSRARLWSASFALVSASTRRWTRTAS